MTQVTPPPPPPPPILVPICVHCGVKGHIRPKCPKLKGTQRNQRQTPYRNESRDLQGKLRALADQSSWLCKEVEKLARSTNSCYVPDTSYHFYGGDYRRDYYAPQEARGRKNRRRRSKKKKGGKEEVKDKNPPKLMVKSNSKSKMKTIWLRKDDLKSLVTHIAPKAHMSLDASPTT